MVNVILKGLAAARQPRMILKFKTVHDFFVLHYFWMLSSLIIFALVIECKIPCKNKIPPKKCEIDLKIVEKHINR